jgi:type IV pilus biogenesis protein CpaD/CtpE
MEGIPPGNHVCRHSLSPCRKHASLQIQRGDSRLSSESPRTTVGSNRYRQVRATAISVRIEMSSRDSRTACRVIPSIQLSWPVVGSGISLANRRCVADGAA